MRITRRQLTQIIREELLREAAPVTSNPVLMQYMAQMGIGEGEMSKTAELYGLLKRLGPEEDAAVLGAALNSVMGQAVYLATSSDPPVVGSVKVDLTHAHVARMGGSTHPERLPKFLAIYKTSADRTVGTYTLQRVDPDGKLIFELDRTQEAKYSRLALDPDQAIRYLENCMTLSKQMRAISSDIRRGRGRVYDMVALHARGDRVALAELKSIMAFPNDPALVALMMLGDAGAAEEAPEFFTSY